MKHIKRAIVFMAMIYSVTNLLSQNIEILGTVRNINDSKSVVAVKVTDSGKQINEITLNRFNMEDGSHVSISPDMINIGSGYYLLTLSEDDMSSVIELTAAFQGDNNVYKTPKYELSTDEKFYWLGSDVMWDEAVCGKNAEPLIDSSYQSEWYKYGPFVTKVFYKSIGLRTDGSFLFNFPEDNPYSRISMMYGIEQDWTFFVSKNAVKFSFFKDGVLLKEQDMYTQFSTPNIPPYISSQEIDISAGGQIKLAGNSLDANSTGDLMYFLIPRVYMKKDVRKEQTTDLPEMIELNKHTAFTYMLEANFTSGLKPLYRVVHGNDFASVDKDGLITVSQIPEDNSAYIAVEVFQPGNDMYKPSDIYTCKIYIDKQISVNKGERFILYDGDHLSELTVTGDASGIGEVVVESGMAKVDKLLLKYTFTPGEWNFISFPSPVNISKISNLEDLGYSFNSTDKAYYIFDYNTKSRAENPEKSAWTSLLIPVVERHKGYIMGVSRSEDNPDNTPVEVTFIFDNIDFSVSSQEKANINTLLDLSGVNPGETFPIYIMADGVKSNILKLNVTLGADAVAQLPMDFQKELDDARITFTPDKKGIRFTLPESTPANVLFFNERSKLVKAVKYVSPFVVDISDLKKGKYDILIQYGNGKAYKNLIIE